MPVYDINGLPISGVAASQDINCKIIAHRGYHVIAAQNSIAAFKAAAAAGFSWIEIDIRRCLDGIYVMSHDATVTLYNNGVPESVTIESTNYSDIKGYTWDAAGNYEICALQSVFNSMKLLDMRMICDRKSGNNTEIVRIAALCGATDRIMISYSSYAAAYSDRELFQKYDAIPLRIYPSNYADYLTLAAAVTNPIYSDMNVSSTGSQTALPIALACGLPIIFSGCTMSNKNRWCVLASGVMANLNLNISYSEFFNALNNNYDQATTITPSVSSASVAAGGTATVAAASDLSSPGGYVYGFSNDPRIATVKQTAFGQNASFTLTGVAAGSTSLTLFDGCGETVIVPITVS